MVLFVRDGKRELQLITISQTPQDYDIYSNSGELILEFTRRNLIGLQDLLSLKGLF